MQRRTKTMKRWVGVTGGAAIALVAILIGCQQAQQTAAPAPMSGPLGGEMQSVINERGLTPDDVTAALKTYVPSGKMDEYVIFASGGHSGQVHLLGVPSMRLLKTIAVFTPEPWQGYGIGNKGTEEVLKGGDVDGRPVRWADTHHPALSETAGDYDGQFCFINDKAAARVAVIDLRDFETKQIVKNPILMNDHGGTFVTPNTDYIVEAGQYSSTLDGKYAPIEDYKKSYRGFITFWKFDRKAGRIIPSESFGMELPPYWHDLADAGKKVSEGWIFLNSLNSEMATGGIEKGNPPFEAGTTQRDMDYMHVINLKKATEVALAGKVEKINGFNVIRLQTAIDEKLLHLVPEPKSPHGVDITPGGEYIVVSGKLSPHTTVFSFEKILKAIEAGPANKDEFGVPILAFEEVLEAQVEIGLGPLHTQFDDRGYAYTSVFLDSAVARWTLGGPYQSKHSEPAWTMVTKTPVHYNVGHLTAAEGDTVSPDGKYLIALNKWSVDRFLNVGPLLPQNFQLIDLSFGGEKMPVLYDSPIGVGEPHYAQTIKADKLKGWEAYPEVGWDPEKQAVDPKAPKAGEERVERNGNQVDVYMTVVRSHYKPEHVEIKKGDHVRWHLTSLERGLDTTHGFALCGYNVNLSLEPGETASFEFTAEKEGVYSYYCTEFCSALHLEMTGYMFVTP